MRLIALDGYFKGHMWGSDRAPQELRIPRPTVLTTCLCQDTYHGITYMDAQRTVVYKLAFRSVDGNVALYSQSGKSEDVIKSATTITIHPGPIPDEIVVDCRDPHAFAGPP